MAVRGGQGDPLGARVGRSKKERSDESEAPEPEPLGCTKVSTPFRFGVQISKPPEGESWQSTARHVEDLGYSSLLIPDHFGDQLAPIPAMMSAAEATTTLKVGALVLDNDYKHPVVMTKEMATIDLLSGGRAEFGLGAGWMRTDYEQSGIAYDPPKVRVDRFEEALEIIVGLLGDGAFSFSGDHYEVTALDGLPKPVRPDGIPILIGGGGPRVLRIAGRFADIVSINPNMKAGEFTPDAAKNIMPEEVDKKLEWVRQGAGDRFDQIEISSTLFFVAVNDDRDGTASNVASMFGVEPKAVLGTPIAAIGTADQIADSLEQRRERWGMTYVICQADGFEPLAPVVAKLSGN
jgi:probable F420-dependent oxidoreductase